MRKAFTLVEMLVVTVVIVTLMSIVFRLAGLGSSTEARNRTITRIQRLENCISGYYAAFGSYPPVKLHGSRNSFYEVNERGIQQVSRNPGTSFRDTDKMWRQIEAACRSQPVAMKYPYASDMHDYVRSVSEALRDLHNQEPDSAYGKNPALAYLFNALDDPGLLNSKSHEADWTEIQLFQFGLMSYLLPRYLVMMGHNDSSIYGDFVQWCNNNELPSKFDDGTPYNSWDELNQQIQESSSGAQKSNRWKVELLPSQAVTARWLANLEGQLTCERQSLTLYGVGLAATDDTSKGRNISVDNPYPVLYSAEDSQSGSSGGNSRLYALDGVTCKDGWGNDFYYYSPPPYQTYRLWSAGPNGKTFPPWVSAEEIRNNSELSRYQRMIMDWMADDVVQMSN